MKGRRVDDLIKVTGIEWLEFNYREFTQTSNDNFYEKTNSVGRRVNGHGFDW